jgi:hypothetical protein
MHTKLTENSLQVKMGGTVIGCTTLERFLSLLPSSGSTRVFLEHMQVTYPYGAQEKNRYVIHITARPSHTSPILAATFTCAITVRSYQEQTLIAPFRMQGKAAETSRQQLQKEMQTCLQDLLEHDAAVSEVLTDAHFLMPEEWVWELNSRTPRIQLVNKHWTLGTGAHA